MWCPNKWTSPLINRGESNEPSLSAREDSVYLAWPLLRVGTGTLTAGAGQTQHHNIEMSSLVIIFTFTLYCVTNVTNIQCREKTCQCWKKCQHSKQCTKKGGKCVRGKISVGEAIISGKKLCKKPCVCVGNIITNPQTLTPLDWGQKVDRWL